MAMQGLRRSNTVAVCRPDANNLLAWFDQGGLFWVELQVSGEVYGTDRRRVSHLSTTASPGVLPIGRGRSLTAPPSHTTWHRSRTSIPTVSLGVALVPFRVTQPSFYIYAVF